MMKSTLRLLRPEDTDDRRPPANSTDQFAALVQQHDSEIAVVSKPHSPGKDTFNMSASARASVDDELNMNGTDQDPPTPKYDPSHQDPPLSFVCPLSLL